MFLPAAGGLRLLGAGLEQTQQPERAVRTRRGVTTGAARILANDGDDLPLFFVGRGWGLFFFLGKRCSFCLFSVVIFCLMLYIFVHVLFVLFFFVTESCPGAYVDDESETFETFCSEGHDHVRSFVRLFICDERGRVLAGRERDSEARGRPSKASRSLAHEREYSSPQKSRDFQW